MQPHPRRARRNVRIGDHGSTVETSGTIATTPRTKRAWAWRGLVLAIGLVGLGAWALQSSAAFHWLIWPALSRQLDGELELEDGRYRFPARLELSGLHVRSRDRSFEMHAVRLEAALDLAGSYQAGRWILGELRAEGLDVALVLPARASGPAALSDARPATPPTSIPSSRDDDAPAEPLALEVRGIDLTQASLRLTSADGARTTLGPGTLALHDAVRGGHPRGRVSAPVRIAGSNGA